MNPYKLKDVFKYLTSNNQLLKKKLKLGTSEIPIPPKRQDVIDVEVINRFSKANPRVDTTNLKPLSVKHSDVKKPDEPDMKAEGGRAGYEDGGMLVQPSDDGSRPGYKKDNPGSVYKDGNGYSVKIGSSNNPNTISEYFGAKKYGSLEKAKKAAEKFKKKEGKNFEFAPQGPKTGKQAAAEKVIQELLDEGTEITTENILDNMPKKIIKKGVSDTVINKAKKNFPDLDFKRKSSWFVKTPKDIAAVKKLIEDGLPMKEIKAQGYDPKFIRKVASTNELKIAETSREYFENIKKVSNDLTKIGTNKKIVGAFENGTVSKDLINQVGKVTKSGDPFYDSRLLFKLAEYYDGSLEEWYKPKLPKPTSNQLANSDKVIKSSSTFLGGKRNGYAYQNFLYDWGAKKIDQVLDLPLGTFRGIQRDIAKTLPSGISLDEVFGVKSSGRFAPIEGILTNPLASGANVDKGSFVDNVKSNYQAKLIDAAGDPKKQKEILKDYNDIVEKSKVRYPDVEFPDYKVGQPPNKTIKGFSNLPPLIQNKLLENYKTTGISPVTKKAISIFDVAKATGSKTFTKLDEATQANLSNMSSKQQQAVMKKVMAFCPAGTVKVTKAGGGRVPYADGPVCTLEEATRGMNEEIDKIKKGNASAGESSRTVNKLKNLGSVGMRGLVKAGLVSEVLFEAALGFDKVVSEGQSPMQAFRQSYLTAPLRGIGVMKSFEEGEREELLDVASDKGKVGRVLDLQETVQNRDKLINKINNLETSLEDQQDFDDGSDFVGNTEPLQKNIAELKAQLQESYRDGQVNRADELFSTKPQDLKIKDQSLMDAYNNAIEKRAVDQASNSFKAQSIAADKNRIRDANKAMIDLGGTYQDYKNPFTKDEYENFARKEGYLPSDKAYTDKYFTDAILNPMKFEQLMEKPGFLGASEKFASGGIASLTKTIPPESGPTPQGLPYVYNNVKKI